MIYNKNRNTYAIHTKKDQEELTTMLATMRPGIGEWHYVAILKNDETLDTAKNACCVTRQKNGRYDISHMDKVTSCPNAVKAGEYIIGILA